MIRVGGYPVGDGSPLLVIAGPDVIESEAMALNHARALADICQRAGVPYVFKCSYDKANRTSVTSFRGPGLLEGTRILHRVRQEVGVPVLTDIHETGHAAVAAEAADVLQIPAFLCRQTDLIAAAAKTGRALNIKKGQFVAPADIAHSVEKARAHGASDVFVTERGASFGYRNLVVDMRSLMVMREAGLVTCFDATHSVQLPSADGGKSGGERRFVAPLARAAVAVGVDAIFAEVHETPDRALCDGPCSLDFTQFTTLLGEMLAIRKALASPG